MKEVKLTLYNKIQYRGELTIPYTGASVHKYVEESGVFAADEELEFDMIKVDDRFIIIPMYENFLFLMNIWDKVDDSFSLVAGNEVMDLSDMYVSELKEYKKEQKMISAVEDLMTKHCDLYNTDFHVTEIKFKNQYPTCPKCGNVVKL